MIDMGLKIKVLRELRGISQKDLAKLTLIGEKTISSFETGQRIGSLKFSQLEALVTALGSTVVEFLTWNPEVTSAPMETQPFEVTLPPVVQIASRRSLEPRDPLRGIRRESDHPTPQSPLSRAM